MKSFLTRTCIFILLLSGIAVKNQGQSAKKTKAVKQDFLLVDELNTMADMGSLPAFREQSPEAQVSSFDTTGGNDDGFNGKYSFLRKNADGSLVLFDLKGPGVINRIWTPTPTEDTLDFYLDDETRPGLSIRFIDLFSGKQAPFIPPLCGNQLGGYYCYFPILFQRSCRIVYRGKKIQFFQIQYRRYPPNSHVEKFGPVPGATAKQVMERIAKLWNKPERKIQDFARDSTYKSLITESTILRPGDTKSVFSTDQGGRILGLEFERGSSIEWNKQVDLRISWDDERVPAIYCPITDFFGYAFGKASMQSLLLGSRGSTDYCFFPMPFFQKARIELVYRTGGEEMEPVNFRTIVYYSAEKLRPEKEGRFYAAWKSHDLAPGEDAHVWLDMKGRGHYVASLLQARGLRPGMTYFFEGDDSTAIDGYPKIHGTGSEDYFNGGWYALLDRWDRAMSLPIHGALDYSLPFSRTGGYRLYLSDKIPFEKSIFQSIEHGPVGNSIAAHYTSVALYYCNQPAPSIEEPTNALTRLPIPDTLMIYPQLMDLNLEGAIQIKTLWAFNTGGESFLFTVNGESWIRIGLKDIPPGQYRILIDYAKIPDGATFSLWQRQTKISEWISTVNPTRERVEALYLGDTIVDGMNSSLTLRVRADAMKNSFFFNRLILIRK